MRDEPIGVLAVGPATVHQALLFRQLTADLVYFTRGTELDDEAAARLEALGVRVVEDPVAEVVTGTDGTIAGVLLAGGGMVERRVLTVGTALQPRLEGLGPLGLPVEELPGGMGRRVVSGIAGTTEVPGVWVAGNVTDPMAQVGASAATGAMAGAHLNAHLVAADADAAVAARAGAA